MQLERIYDNRREYPARSRAFVFVGSSEIFSIPSDEGIERQECRADDEVS